MSARHWLAFLTSLFHGSPRPSLSVQNSIKPELRRLALCGLAAAFLWLFLLAPCRAQITNVTHDQATPTPGSGHDYIHLLAETVDPSNGSLNVRIQVPVPDSRGITIPFAFVYNSNGVTYPSSTNNGVMFWAKSDRGLQSGGWAYSVPYLEAQKASLYPGTINECDYYVNYMFTDPSGGRHALRLSAWDSSTTYNCTRDGGPYQVLSGGDDFYRADAATGGAFARVISADGTVYYFTYPGTPSWV